MWKNPLVLSICCALASTLGCDVVTEEEGDFDAQQFRSANTVADFDGISYVSYIKGVDADTLLANCSLEIWVNSGYGTEVFVPDVDKWDQQYGATNIFYDRMRMAVDLTDEGHAFFDDRGISTPPLSPGNELTSLLIVIDASTNYPTAPRQRWHANVQSIHDVNGQNLWASVPWDGQLEVVTDCS